MSVYCRHSIVFKKCGLFEFESLHLTRRLNHNQDPDTTWRLPRALVKELKAKRSVQLKVDLISFVLPYRNLQTWLESSLDQLAATVFSSLLTLILQQEVYFLERGEWGGVSTDYWLFPDVFPRTTPYTAHFLMTHARREYTYVCMVGRRTHSVKKNPTTVLGWSRVCHNHSNTHADPFSSSKKKKKGE